MRQLTAGDFLNAVPRSDEIPSRPSTQNQPSNADIRAAIVKAIRFLGEGAANVNIRTSASVWSDEVYREMIQEGLVVEKLVGTIVRVYFTEAGRALPY